MFMPCQSIFAKALLEMVLANSLGLGLLSCNLPPATAQTTVDFYGESTFRGYDNGVERDNPAPLRPSSSRPEFAWLKVAADRSPDDTRDTKFNVPRRVAELSAAAPLSVSFIPSNHAVSGSPIELIALGGQDLPLPFRLASASSVAGVVVINTGINNAVTAFESKLPRALVKQHFQTHVSDLAYQAERTGKRIIFLLPNPIPNGGALPGPNDYLDDFKTAIQNVKNIGFYNMEIVQNPVAVLNGLDPHPSMDGYDLQAHALALPVSTAVSNARRQQRICQLYVGFFDRVVEAESADYWLGQLARFGEDTVAEMLYDSAPGFGNEGLTGPALIDRYFQHLFGQKPDSDGAAYWETRRQVVGNGAVLIELIRAAEKTTNRSAIILAQKINISMTHAFMLRRQAVNNTAFAELDGTPQKVLDITTRF